MGLAYWLAKMPNFCNICNVRCSAPCGGLCLQNNGQISKHGLRRQKVSLLCSWSIGYMRAGMLYVML